MTTPAITPSIVDLAALGDVKAWLGIQPDNTDDDSVIQFCITAFSQYVLNKTGRESFNSVQNFSEFYDGNGNDTLFVDNTPIVTLTSVTIGSYSVPMSTSTVTSGVYVIRGGKAIAFRSSAGVLMPPRSIYPYFFTPGRGNVQVVYSAGYTRVPFDLMDACIQTVAQNYRRRDWIDLASKAITAGGGVSGTTSYRNWIYPPYVDAIMDSYSRYARPS